MNGKGGWSYYNPNAVLKVIVPNIGLPKCVDELEAIHKDEKIQDKLKNLQDNIVSVQKRNRNSAVKRILLFYFLLKFIRFLLFMYSTMTRHGNIKYK